MREAMVKMEQERLEMVAEVEAQIERALQSMQVDLEDDSDYESRPPSRLSSRSASGTRTPHRKHSDASRHKQLRSYGTDSTLVDYDLKEDNLPSIDRSTDTVIEEEEEEAPPRPISPISPSKKKRFSAEVREGPQDAMVAVDEGISEKSDRIAQKVLQIQRKVLPTFYFAFSRCLITPFTSSSKQRWLQSLESSTPAVKARITLALAPGEEVENEKRERIALFRILNRIMFASVQIQ
jgi:hypothetical protein